MMYNFGSPLNNGNLGGYSGQNFRNVGEVSGGAVLFVMKPSGQRTKDTAIRPFQYNFDDNFIVTTGDLIDQAKRGTTSTGAMLEAMKSKVNLNEYLMPSSNPQMTFKTSLLSDNWRFILILTDSGSNLKIGNTLVGNPGTSNVRRIYNGYFEDEPYNTFQMGGLRPTLNPHAYMVITHKTVVGTAMESGPMGSHTRLSHYGSEEIIHPNISVSHLVSDIDLRRGGIHLMTPENCGRGIEISDDGLQSVSSPGLYTNISNEHAAQAMSDVFEQPAHNVGHVIRGVLRYTDEMESKKFLSTGRAESYMDDFRFDDSIHKQNFARHLSIPIHRRGSIFDLDVNSRISALDIDSMVNGTLEVHSIIDERPMMYETLDTGERSITNQYSYLIASVIGPVLNSAGLQDMSFAYQIARTNRGVIDDWYVETVGPTWPISDTNTLARMQSAAQSELANGIFRTIFESMGSFEVRVKATSTGMTTVRLSLVDQGLINNVDFELPTYLGGLISPILGTSIDSYANTEALNGLMNLAAGTTSSHMSSMMDYQPPHQSVFDRSGFNDGDGNNFFTDDDETLDFNLD